MKTDARKPYGSGREGTEKTLIKEILTDDNKKLFKKNAKKAFETMSNHISKILPLISVNGLGKKIPFNKSNEYEFIEACGIKPKDILEAAKKSKSTNMNFRTQSNPFLILSAILVYFYKKENVTVHKNEIAKLLTLYITIKAYRSAMVKHFRKFDPNPEVMDYTIENLDSNKYSIKKFGTMYATLVNISDTQWISFDKVIDEPTDANLHYYVSNIHSRVSNLVKIIAEAYYDNIEHNRKITIDTMESENDEGRMYTNDNSNISTRIEQNARVLHKKFNSEIAADMKMVAEAAKQTRVSKSKLNILMNKIISDRAEQVSVIIKDILANFYSRDGERVKSSKFISISMDVYKVSNTSDPIIINIKKVLGELVDRYSKEYLKSAHKSTIIGMKKAIYIYIVLFMVKNS